MPTIVRVDMDEASEGANVGVSNSQGNQAVAKVGVGGSVDASSGENATETIGKNKGENTNCTQV